MNGYGEIYRFEFDGTCNPFGTLLTTKGKVSILKKDYAGSVTEIPHGQATPIVIDYPTSDDDIFYPIKGSMVSFKVLGGVLSIDSLSSDKEKEYLLEYYRDNVLFWRGFVSPEMCEEDIFLRYPAIEFKTIDGLGSLEGSKLYDNITNSPIVGYRSIGNIIFDVLNNVGLQYGVNFLCNLKREDITTTAPNPFFNTFYIYANSLYDALGTKLNPLEVIKSIAQLFNCIVFQDGGVWWFVKPKDLGFNYRSAGPIQNDGYPPTPLPSTLPSIPILEHGTDFLIVAEPKRRLKKLYKSIELEYEQLQDGGNLDPYFSVISSPTYDYNFVYPTIFKPTYSSYTQTTTVGGVTTTTTLYDQLEFVKFYNQTNPSYRYPDYEFYTVNGNAIAEMIYNPDSDEYGMVIRGGTANTDYVEYELTALLDSEFSYKYDFSVSSITKNIKVALIVGGNYYDAANREWTTTPIINTFGSVDTVNINGIQAPDNNTPFYIRFYNNSLPTNIYFDGISYASLAEYHAFRIKLNIPYRSKQIITATNIKDATIVPEKVKVYNGHTIPHPNDGVSYPTYDPWYYPQFVYPDISNTGYILETPSDINLKEVHPNRNMLVAERDETFYYSLQELSARNILNQYSDNTNIFSGTIIGKGLRFGAIYKFPNQGALADRYFFPLSIELNERDCTANVVFLELSTNEIDPSIVSTVYDSENNVKYQSMISSKKKIVTA